MKNETRRKMRAGGKGGLRAKHGQVTIFVILGIIIVFGILSFFILIDRGGNSVGLNNLGPDGFVVGCVRDVVEGSVNKLMESGGEISAWQTITYKNKEWTYLCYQADYYQGCYNLYPMLELQIEKEIERDINTGIQGCFSEMKEVFEGSGFDVSLGVSEYFVDLLPGYVSVDLKKNVEVSDNNGARIFDDFDIEVLSPIYDLVRVARDIVNGESQFCNFEYNGYMLLYPKYDIRRVDYQDSKMYRVIDRNSKKEFKFAVRSCVFPPGL